MMRGVPRLLASTWCIALVAATVALACCGAATYSLWVVVRQAETPENAPSLVTSIRSGFYDPGELQTQPW